jgi:predicted RNA-binding protein YlxR (DUF448 family)
MHPPRRPLPPGRKATPDAPDITPDETADEDDPPERGPLRRCVVTRARMEKERMIRFVIGPDRLVVPDLAARLPGRGIWLSAQGDVIETARTRGAFAKAARGPVTVPPDLTSVLQASLARRIGEFLGLARRAGQAVCGFQKAREWLDAHRAGLVMEASDGSADERARFLGRHAAEIKVISPLDGAAMGAVFGRDHVVHVAVARGRLAEVLEVETGRLAGLSAIAPMREPPARPGGRISKSAGG